MNLPKNTRPKFGSVAAFTVRVSFVVALIMTLAACGGSSDSSSETVSSGQNIPEYGPSVALTMPDTLTGGPRTTGDLVDRFDHLCRTAVMKHLDVLVAAKLVIVRREGRVRWNYLNSVPIERVCARWVDGHMRRMSSALIRLKDVVEADLPAATKRLVKEQES